MHGLHARRSVLALSLCGVFVHPMCAQQNNAAATQQQQLTAAPTGEVTGTVLSQETQKPVRFAVVYLQSVDSVNAANSQRNSFRGGGRSSQETTEVDGTFTIDAVAPGDYYVTASAQGYMSERSVLQAAVNSGSDPAQLLAGIPVVHVSADSSSNVVVTLQRGGALAGRVVWEDGSPAAGVNISAVSAKQQNTSLPAPLQGLQLNGAGLVTVTDDRGDFRLAGMPSDDYLVQALIQSGGRRGFIAGRGIQLPSTVRVYAPNVFRKSAAKTYSLRSGDERTDVQMVIDLRGLHTVSGHVSSADVTQSIVTGRVTLTDPNEPTLQMLGSIDPQGDFTVRYVPPGSYTLQIFGASTQINGGFRGRDSASTTPAVTFKSFSQSVVVSDTDLSGFTATLTPDQPATR